MQVSYNWLKEYVDFDLTPEQVAEIMTGAGVTIEQIESLDKGVEKVVVALVVEREKHPDAEKLSLCQVTTNGEDRIQVVCGAPNVAQGQKIPFAMVGAKLPDGLKIKKAKLRGVESFGMICSAKELGMDLEKLPAEQKEGILVLPEDAPLGMDIREFLQLNDYILELDLTPNRSDCLSVLNIARELGALLGKEVKTPQVTIEENKENINDLASVDIQASDLCHRYVAKMVKGVKVQPSPLWLQHKLQCAGVRPINNIVDVTNYILMEFGQPLHAFDYNYLAEGKIIVRRANEGEKITTLDEQERELTNEMLVITDPQKAVAVAGVMGGANSEVTDETTDVLIEAAYFAPTTVRKTSTKLGLRSESSIRFEKGINIETVALAAEKAAQMMQELGGGEIVGGIIDNYPTKHERTVVELPLAKVNKVLGTDISDERIKEILTQLNFVILTDDGVTITVEVPPYRPDVTIKEDLIEEVARVYGYDNIPTTLPYGATNKGEKTPEQKLRDEIVDRLASLGLHEVINFSFINKNHHDKLGFAADDRRRNSVAVMNPLSEEQGHMRTTILPGILENMVRNVNRKNENIAIFELGKVYLLDGEITAATLAEEKWTLGIGMRGKTLANWQGGAQAFDFYYLKGIVEALFAHLHLSDVEFKPCKDNSIYHPGRSANVFVSGQLVGVIGELHPAVADNYDLGGRNYVAEIDVDMLIQIGVGKIVYQNLAKYPAVNRDLAVVVKEEVLSFDLLKDIKANGGELLIDAQIFDVYQGGQIEAGNKSLAFSLTFQADDRTLTDVEINEVYDKIYGSLQEKFDATMRA